jgi:hypothetical protein
LSSFLPSTCRGKTTAIKKVISQIDNFFFAGRKIDILKVHENYGWKYTLPKVTKPAFAFSASAFMPLNSRGGAGDHIQEGALFSAAVLLASTNSYI